MVGKCPENSLRQLGSESSYQCYNHYNHYNHYNQHWQYEIALVHELLGVVHTEPRWSWNEQDVLAPVELAIVQNGWRSPKQSQFADCQPSTAYYFAFEKVASHARFDLPSLPSYTVRNSLVAVK